MNPLNKLNNIDVKIDPVVLQVAGLVLGGISAFVANQKRKNEIEDAVAEELDRRGLRAGDV